jgi:hypothetical protein
VGDAALTSQVDALEQQLYADEPQPGAWPADEPARGPTAARARLERRAHHAAGGRDLAPLNPA